MTSVRRHLRQHLYILIMACALLSAMINAAHAQNNIITSIVTTEDHNQTTMRIVMAHPVTHPPIHFSITNPDRIALDFMNTSNGTGKLVHEPKLNNLPTYTLTQSGTRIRMVLTLTAPSNYMTSIEHNTLTVHITRIVPQDKQPPLLQANNTAGTTPVLSDIRTVDFHHSPNAQGRILITLSDPRIPINVRQQGDTLITELLGAKLVKKSHALLEVQQFNTPVQTIHLEQNGSNVRMTIKIKGQWLYHALQTNAQFSIDISPDTKQVAAAPAASPTPPGKAPPAATTPANTTVVPPAVVSIKTDDQPTSRAVTPGLHKPSYKGAPLSFNFQNVEVRTILQVIADFTGLNIIASDSVRGTLTMRLKEVPWDQALDIVMQARGLDVRRNGSVLWIAPKDELLNKEKQELEQRALIRSLEPLHAEVFQLNYQKVDEFRKSFGINEDGSVDPARKNTVLSARGSAVIDKRTNQIFVTDTEFVMAHIRTLLKKIDVPSKQVLIEARIVEADDKFSRNLGTRLGFSTKNNAQALGNNYQHVAQFTDPNAVPDTMSTPGINLPAQPISGNAGSFAISLFNATANRFLNLELSALEADGYGKILSSPRVVTADQQAALIEQGEELPYQQATSSGATSTAFRKANLKLEVTPQITPDGNVILTVDVNKDSRGDSTPAGLAINTKHVKTQVQVENGGTVVIGGIYTQTDLASTSRIPWLGNLPGIGFLFRSTQQINDKTELLIFLTPKVISDNKLAN
jgi:type IV pilus assembly protein PilQ